MRLVFASSIDDRLEKLIKAKISPGRENRQKANFTKKITTSSRTFRQPQMYYKGLYFIKQNMDTVNV